MKNITVSFRAGPMFLRASVRIDRCQLECGQASVFLAIRFKRSHPFASLNGWPIEGIVVSKSIYRRLRRFLLRSGMKPKQCGVSCETVDSRDPLGREGMICVTAVRIDGCGNVFPDKNFGVRRDKNRVLYPFGKQFAPQ